MGDGASVVRYCPSCGEEVVTYALEKMGVTAQHCYECSLCLDWQAQDASPELQGVYVVGLDNIARFRLVRTGAASQGAMEIHSGLSAGERVVVAGVEKVTDGAKIEGAKP